MRQQARGGVAVLRVVIAVALLQGCGGDPSSDETREPSEPPASESSAGPSDEESRPPAPGEVGSEECLLRERDVNLVIRDWTRVEGTVGRPDHGRFTRQLLDRLDTLDARAATCDGYQTFGAFETGVARLDRRAEDDPDYALYATVEDAGNEWLQVAGVGADSLLRG